MRVLVTTMSVVALAASTPAAAQFVNGYAVGNHRPCGVSSLPGTIPELEKFFASAEFPADLRKNFLWTDAKVKVTDWTAGTDSYDSADTVNGKDGVDAGLISYIASHGVTRSAKYTAYAGGATSSQCQINSSSMGIGDQDARYLILSTCQGVKIGTGDDPTQAGENPSVTWRTANQGLNCVLGYSNNMADADGYGVNLLHQLATTDASLAAAFYKASRAISMRNIPAVLCFGRDDAAALANLNSSRRFVEERYGRGGSAFSYDRARMLEGRYTLAADPAAKQRPAKRLTARARNVAADALAHSLIVTPGMKSDAIDRAVTPELEVYRTAAGTVTRDLRTGAVDWIRNRPAQRAPFKLSDAASVRVAAQFLAARGFVTADEVWVPTYIVDRGLGDAKGSMVVGKTVIFHEKLGGLTPLGVAGSAEVVLDADGEPAGATLRAVEVQAATDGGDVDPAAFNADAARARAVAELTRREPDAEVSVVETRVGYDFGDPLAAPTRGVATVEVTVEVRTGDVARNHIVRYAL